MASFDCIFFMDQSSSSSLLNIKLNQNMVLLLDPTKYSPLVQPLISCLDHSVSKKYLVLVEDVPISQLQLAFSTASYNKQMDVMKFLLQGVKTTISNSNFCKLLGLSIVEDLISPNNIYTLTIIQVYNQMGYISDLSVLSRLKKFSLTPIWNAFLQSSLDASLSVQLDLIMLVDYFIICYMEFILGKRLILHPYYGKYVESISSENKDTIISCAAFGPLW